MYLNRRPHPLRAVREDCFSLNRPISPHAVDVHLSDASVTFSGEW